MKQKYAILYFVMIVVSLFITTAVYVFARFGTLPDAFLLQLLINIPFCLLYGGFDLYIIKHNRIKKNAIRIAVNLLITTLFALLLPSFINYYFSGLFSIKEAIKSSIMIIPWNWLVVLQIELFYFHSKQIEMEKEKNLYQFEALKNQINPHFLFNCLNVLSSLAYQNAEKTNLFAKKLSNVYRYLLATHNKPTVTLEEELQFVDSYLFLEQIRFGKTLQVSIKNSKEYQQQAVVPASLQMLVENAIKHNMNTTQSPLIIHIIIGPNGVEVSNNLQLRNFVTGNGMGLTNLRKQYALHGQKINITQTSTAFIVRLPFIET